MHIQRERTEEELLEYYRTLSELELYQKIKEEGGHVRKVNSSVYVNDWAIGKTSYTVGKGEILAFEKDSKNKIFQHEDVACLGVDTFKEAAINWLVLHDENPPLKKAKDVLSEKGVTFVHKQNGDVLAGYVGEDEESAAKAFLDGVNQMEEEPENIYESRGRERFVYYKSENRKRFVYSKTPFPAYYKDLDDFCRHSPKVDKYIDHHIKNENGEFTRISEYDFIHKEMKKPGTVGSITVYIKPTGKSETESAIEDITVKGITVEGISKHTIHLLKDLGIWHD